MGKLRLNVEDLKVESFDTLPEVAGQAGTVFGYMMQTTGCPSCGTNCQDCETNDTQGGGECQLWYTCNVTCNDCTTECANNCTGPETCICL